MATLTAQILVGTSHPYHDGINPTHYVFLSENDRPAWVLVHQNIFKENREDMEKIIWIPTVENMLEDALLMIAIHVCRNKEVIELAKSFSSKIETDKIDLYSDLAEAHRKQLYKKCRQVSDFPKIIISVFKGSTIEKQLNVLEQYGMDVEVCIPIKRDKMSFTDTWSILQNQLNPGIIIRNWTAYSGFLKDSFTIVSVSQNYIEVDTPGAETIQKIPKHDFQIVYNLWNDYCHGKVKRYEIRDQTRFSKYIISILHWLQTNYGGQLP